jgi:hypothetical protein
LATADVGDRDVLPLQRLLQATRKFALGILTVWMTIRAVTNHLRTSNILRV